MRNAGSPRNPVKLEQVFTTARRRRTTLRPGARHPARHRPFQVQSGEPRQLPRSLRRHITSSTTQASQSVQTTAGIAAAFTKEPPESRPPDGAPPLILGLLGNVVSTRHSAPGSRGHYRAHANYYSQRHKSGDRYLGDSGRGVFSPSAERARRREKPFLE